MQIIISNTTASLQKPINVIHAMPSLPTPDNTWRHIATEEESLLLVPLSCFSLSEQKWSQRTSCVLFIMEKLQMALNSNSYLSRHFRLCFILSWPHQLDCRSMVLCSCCFVYKLGHPRTINLNLQYSTFSIISRSCVVQYMLIVQMVSETRHPAVPGFNYFLISI
jgi:hypothetical protein